jgi:hypothetical protein
MQDFKLSFKGKILKMASPNWHQRPAGEQKQIQ